MLKKKRLGDRLLEAGVIDKLQLRAALGQQGQWGKTLGRTLLEMRLITEEQLLPILSEHLNMPAISLADQRIDATTATMLDEEFCRMHECVPFNYHEHGKFLDVAMTDAQNGGLFDQIRVQTQCNVRPFLAGPEAIRSAIAAVFGEDLIPVKPQFMLTETVFDFDRALDDPSPEDLPEDAPDGPSTRVELGGGAQNATAPGTQQMLQLERMVLALQERNRRQEQYLRSLVQHLRELFGDLATQGVLRGRSDHPLVGQARSTAPPTPNTVPFTELAPLVGGLQRKDSQEIDVDVIFDGVDIDLTPTRGPAPLPESPPVAAPPAPAPGLAPATALTGDSMPLVDVPPGSPTVVAMDMGTTRSSVAAVIDGRVCVLKLPGGQWDMASVVGFRKDGTVMLGQSARKMLASDPNNAIASPKRLLGRRFDDRELQPYLASLGMTALEGPGKEILLETQGRTITVIEACGHILNLLRLVAEKSLGREVHEVILTTPVSFTERQHAALKEAAEMAQLRVLEFIEEPVAATLACVSDSQCTGLVGLFDFGGGTFDFSVVEMGEGSMKIIATAGDGWLGGDDLDDALASAAANSFWRSTNIELRNQIYQWQRLLVRSEHAKRQLSRDPDTTLELPGAALTQQGGLDLVFPITRRQFSDLCADTIQRAIDTCGQALALAGLKPSDLNALYLSGGTTHVPAVHDAVVRFFGQQPRVVVPPERAVLIGAAVHGALYARDVMAGMGVGSRS